MNAVMVGEIEDEDMVDEEDGRSSVEEEEEKSSTEEELEKAVFGDSSGFRQQLQTFQDRATDETSEEEEEHQFAEIPDADLFFADGGVSEPQSGSLTAQPGNETYSSVRSKQPPVWLDSDDERMTISLESVPRLKKLRRYEGEDLINGREYMQRLRRQYELLHPRPAWSKWDPESQLKKRRRQGSASGHEEASSSSDESESEVSVQPLSDLLRSSSTLTRRSEILPNKRIKLRQEVIAMERMKDIEPVQPSPITSIDFHRSSPLIVSGGTSSTMYLHHLYPHPTVPDPPNPLITSLHLKHSPLHTAVFSPPTPDGLEASSAMPKIYLSSRRRYFHVWDLSTGKIRKITRLYGNQETQRSMEVLKPSPRGRYIALLGSTKKGGGVVNVLDATTLQWAMRARIDGKHGIADFVWWPDDNGMTIVNKGGEVSEFSTEQASIVHRWQDEGGYDTNVITVGGILSVKDKQMELPGTHRYVVIGSGNGIVNVYDRNVWPASPPLQPKPTRTLDNLVTKITHLVVSPCAQLLAIASRWKRDALRLVHLPSCTVYRNWPNNKTPLGRISAMAIGEYEQFENPTVEQEKVLVLAIGNEAGALRAWEITG